MKSQLLAQIVNPVLPPSIGGVGNNSDTAGASGLGMFISNIASILLIISAIASFLYLILGGINWVTSEGDKAKLEKARNQILHAIVGLIITASAWAIFTLFGEFLGLNVRGLNIPTFETRGAFPGVGLPSRTGVDDILEYKYGSQ